MKDPYKRNFVKVAGLSIATLCIIGFVGFVIGRANTFAQDIPRKEPDMSQFDLDIPDKPSSTETYIPPVVPAKDFYELSRSEIKSMSWIEIRPYLNTPEKAYDFVVKYSDIEYKAEMREYIQPSEKTLELKTGDCDDFAYLMLDALNYNGFYAKMLSTWLELKGKEKGHANAVYFDRETKEWHYIQPYNTNNLKKGVSKGYSDPENMAKDISKKIGGSYKWYVIRGIEELNKHR